MPQEINNPEADTATPTDIISAVESVQEQTLDSVADSIMGLMGDDNQTVQNESVNEEQDDNDTIANDEGNGESIVENDDTLDDDNQDEDNGESEENQDEDNIEGFSPEQQAIFNKAQSKLRKKYQSARDDRDRLQSEVNSITIEKQKLEAANKNLVAEKTIVANIGTPLPHVQSLTDLQAIEKQAWDVYEWAQNALNAEPDVDDEGNEYIAELPKGNGETQKFTKAQVLKIARNADATIRRDIPARKAWLEQNDKFDIRLNNVFPELKNPNSELSIAVNSAIIHFPVLKSIAGYKEAALSFVLGQRLLKAHGAKAFDVLKKSVVPTKKTPTKVPVSRKPVAPAVSKKTPSSPTITSKPKYKRSTPYSIADDIANYFE